MLKLAMAAAVPLWMMEIKNRGGPTQEDFERCKEIGETLSGPGVESLVVSGNFKAGETAKAFNSAAEGVAILSFCPGGIRFLGMLFCGKHDVYGVNDHLCKQCLEESKQ